MRKPPASQGGAAPGGKPGADAVRPSTILAAAIALIVAGVCAISAALSLYGERNWLIKSITDSDKTAVTKACKNASSSGCKSAKDALAKFTANPSSHISSVQSSQLTASVVLCLALALVAVAVYRGRHWSRWMVLGLWVICSYTGTLAGIASVLSVSQSIPGPFKSLAFLSGAAFIVAVVLVNLRPSAGYFAAHKPLPAAGAAAPRPGLAGLFGPRRPAAASTAPGATVARPGLAGLFGPRRPAATSTAPAANGARPGSKATTRTPSGAAAPKSKAKVRADEAAVARGAELARSRAKAASKSRRTE